MKDLVGSDKSIELDNLNKAMAKENEQLANKIKHLQANN